MTDRKKTKKEIGNSSFLSDFIHALRRQCWCIYGEAVQLNEEQGSA